MHARLVPTCGCTVADMHVAESNCVSLVRCLLVTSFDHCDPSWLGRSYGVPESRSHPQRPSSPRRLTSRRAIRARGADRDAVATLEATPRRRSRSYVARVIADVAGSRSVTRRWPDEEAHHGRNL